MQIPKLICHKSLLPDFIEGSTPDQGQVIPLALKNVGGLQKFRIPFKNLSDHDIDVEYQFLEVSKAVSGPALRRQNSCGTQDSDCQSPIEFVVQPSCVKIPASTQAVMLNISAKLKNSYQLSGAGPVPLQRANTAELSARGSEMGTTADAAIKRHHSNGEVNRLQRRLSAQSAIEKYSHLLVAKVKDTQIMFSFIIEASIIEADRATLAQAGLL